MLIVALVLAVIGLAALVTAVVTSNELIAWVCIGASGLGVVLLIVDSIRERASRRATFPAVIESVETTEVLEPVETTEVLEPLETTEVLEPVQTTEVLEGENPDAAESFGEELIEEAAAAEYVSEASEDVAEDIAVEDHPEELVHDEPDYDTPSDDEVDLPIPAEEAAIHPVGESYLEEGLEDEVEVAADFEDRVGYVPGEGLTAESAVVGDESATEVHYAPSPEGSTDAVVYTTSEGADTEYLDAEDSPVGEDRRDQ